MGRELPANWLVANGCCQPLAVRRNRSLAALGPLIRHQMQKTSPSDEALASLFTTLETVPATPLS